MHNVKERLVICNEEDTDGRARVRSKFYSTSRLNRGQLTADDRNRIGAISRKAQRRGVSS